MINDLWGLFVCAAFVVGFVVGSKVAEKEERRLFDRYNCFNACKYRNDPNYVMPIKLDVTNEIRRLNPTNSPILEMVDTTNINRDMTRGGMVEPLFPFNEESAPVSKEIWDLLGPKVRTMTYDHFKKDIGL